MQEDWNYYVSVYTSIYQKLPFSKLRYEKKKFEIIFFYLIPYVSSKKKTNKRTKTT